MPFYLVELTGDAREVVEVEAGNEDEAMANWQSGKSIVLEASGMTPVSARIV